MTSRKREPLTLIALGITALVVALGGLMAGVIYNATTVWNVSSVVKGIAEDSGQGLRALQKSLDSLANMVMDHQTALDHILAEQGGVCTIANTSCCFYVNTSQEVELRATRLLERTKW